MSFRSDQRPACEGLYYPCIIGLICGLVPVVGGIYLGWSVAVRALLSLLAFVAPQLIYAFRKHWGEIRPYVSIHIDRVVGIKLLALAATLFSVWGIYQILSFYKLQIYADVAGIVAAGLPVLGAIAVPYFCTVNRMQHDKFDEYYHVGCLMLGKFNEVDWKEIRGFAASWFIKAFFAPVMLWSLLVSVSFIEKAMSGNHGHVPAYFAFGIPFIFYMDLLIAAAGYLFTLRIFGWEIRNPNPFIGGWLFTLICYPPFNKHLTSSLLKFEDGYEWIHWLADYPTIMTCWGWVTMAFAFLYLWASVPYGLRFSNLTNRGIFTSGILRFTKHPAYISKNIHWWMLYIPFISPASSKEAVINSLQLLGVSFIYFMRARYEEKHLAVEPRYVAYALWIERYGIFRWVGKLFPRLRFQAPPSAHELQSAPQEIGESVIK